MVVGTSVVWDISSKNMLLTISSGVMSFSISAFVSFVYCKLLKIYGNLEFDGILDILHLVFFLISPMIVIILNCLIVYYATLIVF